MATSRGPHRLERRLDVQHAEGEGIVEFRFEFLSIPLHIFCAGSIYINIRSFTLHTFYMRLDKTDFK
jgi:hypothetical protein